MSDLDETNFLERLLSPASKPGIGDANHCPDGNSLSLAADGESSPWLKNAVTAHAAHCSTCAETLLGLKRFDDLDSSDNSADWPNTEKRLDIWFAGAFRTNPIFAAAGATVNSESATRSKWPIFASWQLPFAALGIAALAFAVIGISRLRQPVVQTPRSTVAVATPLVTDPRVVPLLSVSTSETTSPESPKTVTSPAPHPTGLSTQARTAQQIPGRPTAVSPQQGIPVQLEPKETAQNVPPLQPEIPKPVQLNSPAPQPPIVQKTENATSTGLSPTPATESGRSVARSSPTGISSSRGVARPPSIPQRNLGGQDSLTTSSVPPLTLRLDANVRLWLVLTSVEAQPDGTFQFQASLLLPVTAGTSFPLQKQTVVRGIGTIKGRENLLSIREIVVDETSYRLSNPSGISNVHAPGTAWAQKFEAGQVLETGLNAATLYLKSAQVPRPEK